MNGSWIQARSANFTTAGNLRYPQPSDYASHVREYGGILSYGQWVGVGSVCKRNGNPDAIEDVLLAIKEQRPDLRLHGFGLKVQAIERPTVRAMLHSSDSMAWSTAGRRQLSDANDPRLALAYAVKVQQLIAQPCFIQDQLFQWWKSDEKKDCLDMQN